MPSKFDTEKLVGVILRRVSGDIKKEFGEDVLDHLYSDETYKEWADNIGSYFGDDKKKKRYINLLLCLEIIGIKPDECDLWKTLMKMEMPIQFYNMMDRYTQVPGLAARNRAKLKDDEKDAEWWVIG